MIMLCVLCLGLSAQEVADPYDYQQEIIVMPSLSEQARAYEHLAESFTDSDLYFAAACLWSQAADYANAFRCLHFAARDGFHRLDWLEQDQDLAPLRSNLAWWELARKVRCNQEMYEMEMQKARAAVEVEEPIFPMDSTPLLESVEEDSELTAEEKDKGF